jgi:flagellar basal body-associated protein FliL
MNESTVDPSTSATAQPPSRMSRWLIVGVVFGLLGMAGIGAGAWFLLPRGGARVAKAVAVEPEIKVTVPLGAVVVNLSGETRRYLRVGVSLGVPANSDARVIEEHKSQLLDLFIAVLSAAQPDSLTSPEGKAAMKDTLLSRIHEELHLSKVGRVYFTEFVIQ